MLGEWMQREIEQQPALLAALSDGYFDKLTVALRGRRFEAILLAARGSSDHAALYARYLIEVHLRIPAILVAPSVLTRFGSIVRYPACLAIGISQSGSAPDVSEVIGSMRDQGHATLAITNTAGSRLDEVAESSLYLEVGEERSVAATKTYTASLLALYQLVRALGGDLPAPKAPDEAWSETACQVAHSHVPMVTRADPVFCLGRGYSFSTAQEAALKLMECALISAKSYSTADFQHGPKALAASGSAIIAFDEIDASLQGQGSCLLRVPEPENLSEELRPIWQALYAQWLALGCARLKGEDPDRPQFLQKVTRTF